MAFYHIIMLSKVVQNITGYSLIYFKISIRHLILSIGLKKPKKRKNSTFFDILHYYTPKMGFFEVNVLEAIVDKFIS